ncbi:hypothetical protein RFI_17939 [Reticulomyxa filosa]|uniref:J domain-containing protein n=1 Tax=Reticulomyxa filosa TaxID=46433 RepID=X6MZ19_RETFI|nr:hypothetical protein RFI_17939 [Reticulomyxa filosa]|eukprot:ETO19290.1 hypothetical protein RFI_17939 [Reticulomyxa filosa]
MAGDYESYQYDKAYSSQAQSATASGDEYRSTTTVIAKYTELYTVLDVQPNATLKEIQQSFSDLAKQYHPDMLEASPEEEKKQGTEKFRKILLAFQVLKDPERRKEYDTTGNTKFKNKPKSSPKSAASSTSASTSSRTQSRSDSQQQTNQQTDEYSEHSEWNRKHKHSFHTKGTKRSEFNKGV